MRGRFLPILPILLSACATHPDPSLEPKPDAPAQPASTASLPPLTAGHGTVVLSCDIDPDGSTHDCKVLATNGSARLVKAALGYAARARYHPKAGMELPARHIFSINFILTGPDGAPVASP